MWVWSQSTGEMFHDGAYLATGYSGKYTGKNNYLMQGVKFTGPLPSGVYTIKEPYLHPHLGPITMDLEPDPANEMHGRDSFRIHAEKLPPAEPGFASEGCIVLNHAARVEISKAVQSEDNQLQVFNDYRISRKD